MANKPTTFQTMALIYISLIMGVVLFGVMTIFVLGKPAQPQNELNILGYTAIIMSIIIPAAGMYYYYKKISAIKDADLKTKLAQWKIGTIIRAAAIEAPCLFCLVNITLSGADIFLYLYVALLVLMIFNFPTKGKTISELQIAEEELNAA